MAEFRVVVDRTVLAGVMLHHLSVHEQSERAKVFLGVRGYIAGCEHQNTLYIAGFFPCRDACAPEAGEMRLYRERMAAQKMHVCGEYRVNTDGIVATACSEEDRYLLDVQYLAGEFKTEAALFDKTNLARRMAFSIEMTLLNSHVLEEYLAVQRCIHGSASAKYVEDKKIHERADDAWNMFSLSMAKHTRQTATVREETLLLRQENNQLEQKIERLKQELVEKTIKAAPVDRGAVVQKLNDYLDAAVRDRLGYL